MGVKPRPPALVVGGSMGGLRVVESLRRNGYSGPISILGEEPHGPYNRPPLSKSFLSGESSEEELFFDLASDLDATWILGTKATQLFASDKTVVDNRGGSHPFETLVIATGLRAKTLFDLNDKIGGVHALRTLEDAKSLRKELIRGARVVVIGAGFIGCEVAATALQIGCHVTLISNESKPLESSLGSVFGKELQKRMVNFGVRFHIGVGAHGLEVSRTGVTKIVRGVHLNDGSFLEADVVVQAVGSIPNTEWLVGNDLDLSDGVLTDGSMQVTTKAGRSLSGIHAVGDVARFPYPSFGNKLLRVEHWNIPIETAKRAGRVLASRLKNSPEVSQILSQVFSPIPSFWSDQFNINIFGLGIPRLADREELLEGTLEEGFVLGYYSGSNLVGVSGINMKSRVMSYRASLGVTET